MRLVKTLVLNNIREHKQVYRSDIIDEVSLEEDFSDAENNQFKTYMFFLSNIKDKHIPKQFLAIFPTSKLQQSTYGYLINMYYHIEVIAEMNTKL